MAEIANNTQNYSSKRTRSTKKSTRIDLTAMVDVGFLLITFFIVTTNLSKATSMGLFIPKDVKDSSQITLLKQSTVITLLPSANNQIVFYEGLPEDLQSKKQIVDYTHIREVLLKKKQSMEHPKDLYVLIKPSKESSYKNLVDILDELTICNIRKYSLSKISSEEMHLLSTQ